MYVQSPRHAVPGNLIQTGPLAFENWSVFVDLVSRCNDVVKAVTDFDLLNGYMSPGV
jgi:hypothetical protein